MRNEEAEQLAKWAEQSLQSASFTSARISIGVSVCSAPFAFAPGYGFIGFISSVFALLSLMLWTSGRNISRDFEEERAQAIWNRFVERDVFDAEEFAPTQDLQQQISELYQVDPRGETFPLVQAIRLIDAHMHQQQRLEIISFRLEELSLLRQTMHEKLAQLRKLGEDAPESQRRLTELERDEAALQSIHNQISASCARLESILTSVQHAHQVRQLKRELGELSQAAGAHSELALESDAFDIERQIGHEIETFLRLERETDEHLREV